MIASRLANTCHRAIPTPMIRTANPIRILFLAVIKVSWWIRIIVMVYATGNYP